MDAKIAIWIVAKPRAEHVKAVSWLNESSLAKFYLLQIEAIKIADSPPAPLLTLITGPSEGSSVVGETKRKISERHILCRNWWTTLLDIARRQTKLHANISPSDDSWVGAGAGKSGLAYNYIVGKHNARIELYINSPEGQSENKRIFDRLYANKEAIESSYGGELDWQRKDTNIASRIAKSFDRGGYCDDKDKWPEIQEEIVNHMVRFYNALDPYVKKL